jgi:hypothetical protein
MANGWMSGSQTRPDSGMDGHLLAVDGSRHGQLPWRDRLVTTIRAAF